VRSVRLSLSSSPRQCFVDILDNIGHIEGFLKDMGPFEIHEDQKTIFACQYALLLSARRRSVWGRKARGFVQECRGAI